MPNRFQNHYDTLRVDRDATAQGVRKAYRSLAQEFHPDRFEGDGDSAETMARINQAYEVLADPISRTHYDRQLAAHEGRSPRPRAPVRAVFALPGGAAWSWYLLSGVLSVTALTLGFTAFSLLVPRQAVSMPTHSAQHALDTEPLLLVPARRIEPWVAPIRATRLEFADTEPVARLVREGSMKAPPSRRYETASSQ
jgi:DnaJ-domain-containing protein 1